VIIFNLCFLGSQNVDLLADFSWSIGSPTVCMSGIFSWECPFCSSLGDGHFGHTRFKLFLIFDFDGHFVVVW
jgi:hypothetical protein